MTSVWIERQVEKAIATGRLAQLGAMVKVASMVTAVALAATMACVLCVPSMGAAAQAQRAPAATRAVPKPAPAKVAGFFTTPLTLDQMKNKQAVVQTSAGVIVIALLPEAAPNHVGYFMKLAQEGAFTKTTFHRVIKLGIIQGGDPLSKDPAKRAQYGTGGLGVLKAERNAEKHTRGAVSAVLQPDRPDSAGSQFFICVSDQPGLDGVDLKGGYDVFGRVVEGMDVAQKISELPADASGLVTERVEIASVTIRDTPPPEPVPFSTETPEQLAHWRAVLETTAGPITLEFMPDLAPNHVRNFLRLAKLGVYDGTAFHRVVPGFVVQTGAMTSRRERPTEKQQQAIGTVGPEFSGVRHVRGILSMARGDDPNSASTSFFICLGPAPSLDGKYTVFGKVTDGLPAIEQIEQAPRTGEEPVTRIEIVKVRLEQTP
jgi:peptidyl-prolyl cis-trans isomerase B (cyclophilin B)